MRVLQDALGCLSEGVQKSRFHSDTADYQHVLLKYCAKGENSRFGVIEFAIGSNINPESSNGSGFFAIMARIPIAEK